LKEEESEKNYREQKTRKAENGGSGQEERRRAFLVIAHRSGEARSCGNLFGLEPAQEGQSNFCNCWAQTGSVYYTLVYLIKSTLRQPIGI
jgi:hypothetical protein